LALIVHVGVIANGENRGKSNCRGTAPFAQVDQLFQHSLNYFIDIAAFTA
jgi:hypothetical protein